MKKHYSHLSWAKRIKIEALVNQKVPIVKIAEEVGVHPTTIYRELKRGCYIHTNSDLTEEKRYSPDKAHARYKAFLKVKGTNLKIGNNYELAQFIEDRILKDNYSPAAVCGLLKRQKAFEMTFSKQTIYSYIDKGVFLSLTNKDLPVKGKRRNKYRPVRKIQKRATYSHTIDDRPKYIENRTDFGHWEMDSVVGEQGKSKHRLLVLTERKTRKEIIIKLKGHTSGLVVNALNKIEKAMPIPFSKVFKTITVDNGSEFANFKGLETSCIHKNKRRTRIYYCHPYSSWERGSNEVANRLIRRKIPKGKNFDSMTDLEIKEIENWINTYPREMFGFDTAEERFNEEIRRIS